LDAPRQSRDQLRRSLAVSKTASPGYAFESSWADPVAEIDICCIRPFYSRRYKSPACSSRISTSAWLTGILPVNPSRSATPDLVRKSVCEATRWRRVTAQDWVRQETTKLIPCRTPLDPGRCVKILTRDEAIVDVHRKKTILDLHLRHSVYLLAHRFPSHLDNLQHNRVRSPAESTTVQLF
jgi:hypothetical protein